MRQEEKEGNKVSKRCCRISRTLVCSMNKVLNYPATGITIHLGNCCVELQRYILHVQSVRSGVQYHIAALVE